MGAGTCEKRLKGSLIAFHNMLPSTFSMQSMTHSGNDPADRRKKKRENPAEVYRSAVACQLAANTDCCRSYLDSDFTVLSRCRSMQHRGVQEAMCIRRFKPVLCKRKSFVLNLTLFRHTHSMQGMAFSLAKDRGLSCCGMKCPYTDRTPMAVFVLFVRLRECWM